MRFILPTAEAGRRGAGSILKCRILFDAAVRLSDLGLQHTLVTEDVYR
jgi:hypothetical protein